MKSIKEERILCEVYSEGWGKKMPAIFIKYEDGSGDLCIQTGDHFEEAFALAGEYLKAIGIRVVNPDEESVGCAGAYFALELIPNGNRYKGCVAWRQFAGKVMPVTICAKRNSERLVSHNKRKTTNNETDKKRRVRNE